MENVLIGYSLLFVGLIIIAFILSVPKILRVNGFNLEYKSRKYDATNIKALIITTSTDKLGDSNKKTGVYASEMTVPYYEFLDANAKVDIASIKGGKIPIEPISLKYPLRTSYDKRFLNDREFKNKVENSICIDNVNIDDYDLIFLAGGWGASYDFGQSDRLGDLITQANLNEKIIGGICHGPLGLLKAKNKDGESLVKNRNITAVTNKQINELGITATPMHPETKLIKQGANFHSKTAKKDIFATHVEIDNNLVTGQNQNSGKQVADEMLKLLFE